MRNSKIALRLKFSDEKFIDGLRKTRTEGKDFPLVFRVFSCVSRAVVTPEGLRVGQSKSFPELLLETGAQPLKLRAADKVYVGDDATTVGRVAPSEYGRQVSHGGVLDDSLPHRVERFDRLNHKESLFDFLCTGWIGCRRKYTG